MKGSFWCALACVLWVSSSAAAQRRTLQGFETNCSGQPIAADPVTGYVTLSSDAFAACGIASIVTGESPGQVKLGRNVLLFPIAGVTENNAVAGAFSLFSPSTLTIVFAPAVNEVALEVLNVNTPSRLRIASYDAKDTLLSDEAAPAAIGGKVVWSRSAATAVTRVVLSYPQVSGLFSSVNRWFVDQLSFNAWVCGDGEVDNLNGGSELCDDGNTTQCDGCSNTCTASVVGCLDGATCVAPSTVKGCLVCDPSKAAGTLGDVALSPRALGTPCDDALKCTQTDTCNAAGQCVGTPRSCDDAITCTSDACSEAAAGDGCTHALGAHDCLIGTTCVPELALNPSNACQLCDPTRAPRAWSPQANTVRCASPTCIGDQFTQAALCDGAGSCPAVTATSCGTFACATATSCTESCSSDRECAAASHCDAATMKCVRNLAAGAACTANSQCADGLACADGVCCDSACGSKCETCNAPGFAGKCINITFGDPENECPDGSSCRSGNQCVPDAPPMPPPMMGEVLPPAPLSPPDVSTPVMSSPRVLPLGAACDRDQVCGFGVCRDGVCCDSACDGPCEGCNVLGAPPGQCTAYSLGSDPENECLGVGGVCNGERACTHFETRGNGLCSATPATRGGSPYTLGALVAAAALLAWRRRR